METETLFAEEAEPPGRLTGNGLKQFDDYADIPLNTLYIPAAVPARKPVPGMSDFNDRRARAFRKRFFPEHNPQGMA